MCSKSYIAIDLKSFYASVECVMRGLDPLTTNLLVADESRSDRTICLAVTPSLKSYGIPGRPRLFEAKQILERVNRERLLSVPSRKFFSASWNAEVLKDHPEYRIDCIIAVPRMALYIEYSTRIFKTYLKYVSPDDIHVYSIDEVFIDATPYLKLYNMTARQLAVTMIRDVLKTTGITATAGIGSNLYLCKVAMDIVAKKVEADKDGVRIAELDEITYRKTLWNHRPINDFWRIGNGYMERLSKLGIHTMGDIARCSLGKPNDVLNSRLLYKTFGVNAELLIDHAWGIEPCTIKDIKNYRPKSTGISCGQVLPRAYSFDEARIVVREMAESLSLDLVKKRLVTRRIGLWVCYDTENANFSDVLEVAGVKLCRDWYGRIMPAPVNGGLSFRTMTSSTKNICDGFDRIFCSSADRRFSVRRLNLSAETESAGSVECGEGCFWTPSLFDFDNSEEKVRRHEAQKELQERKLQVAVLGLKDKFGKNTVLHGVSLLEGATAVMRNGQIGGHKA